MTNEREKYLKDLDLMVDFFANDASRVFMYSEITAGARSKNPEINTNFIAMLRELDNDRIIDEHKNHGDSIGKFTFYRRPSVGYYQSELNKEAKEVQESARKQKELDNIDASIRAANSVIDTNENQKGFNETTRNIGMVAIFVALCAIVPPVYQAIKESSEQQQLKELRLLLMKKDKEIDSLKCLRPPPPYFYLQKKCP